MATFRIKSRAGGMIFTVLFLGSLIGIMVFAWNWITKFEGDVSRKIEQGQRDIRTRVETAFGVRLPEKTREIFVNEDSTGVWVRVAILKEEAAWVPGELERAGFVVMEDAEIEPPKGEAPDWWKLGELADRKQFGRETPIERSGGETGGAARAWSGSYGKGVILYLHKMK
jgi:hypothetical protein